MTEPFPTRCLLHQVLYQRTSPYGDPYAAALMIDPAGNTHTALACSKLFGDLDKLSELEGREVNLFEDGLATRDFVFIDDVVHYNVEATVQELAGTHVLNVGTGVRQTLVDVVTTLAAVTARTPKYRISGQFRLGDIRHAAASTDRVARTLGAHSFVTFAEGVRQFVEWTEGLASEAQSESRYRNSLDEMKSLGLLRGGGASNG